MAPLIIVVNDDGVFSPGLHAAAEAVMPLGDVLVIAPRYQQTGMGRSFPREEGLGIIETIPLTIGGKQITAYAVHASPAYTVAYAILEIAGRKPDLCISGINYGENLGRNINCSGTVGAAFEANSHGVAALAVSMEVPVSLQHTEEYPILNWHAAQEVTKHFAAHILANGLENHIAVWNINVPASASAKTPIRLTRLCNETCNEFQPPPKRDWGNPYRIQSRMLPTVSSCPEEDMYAVYIDKVISATPLQWDCTAQGSFHLPEILQLNS